MNRVSIPVVCAVLGIIGSAGLLVFRPRMAPEPAVRPVEAPARGPAKSAEPAPSSREPANRTAIAPTRDAAAKVQRAAPQKPVVAPPAATSRSSDDAQKLTQLRAVLEDYKKPGATSLDAYDVLSLAECIIYEKLGVSAPPEGSPDWRKPPWNRPGDMAISSGGSICHIFRDEHPLLARLSDLTFLGGSPQLQDEKGGKLLSPDEIAYIAARVARAESYLDAK